MPLIRPVPLLPATEVGDVHFIAIGGAGMSGIATAYAELGVIRPIRLPCGNCRPGGSPPASATIRPTSALPPRSSSRRPSERPTWNWRKRAGEGYGSGIAAPASPRSWSTGRGSR